MSAAGGGSVILNKAKAQKTKDHILATLAGATPDDDTADVLNQLQAVIDAP